MLVINLEWRDWQLLFISVIASGLSAHTSQPTSAQPPCGPAGVTDSPASSSLSGAQFAPRPFGGVFHRIPRCPGRGAHSDAQRQTNCLPGNAALQNTTLHYTAPHFTALHYTALRYSVQHYTQHFLFLFSQKKITHWADLYSCNIQSSTRLMYQPRGPLKSRILVCLCVDDLH